MIFALLAIGCAAMCISSVRWAVEARRIGASSATTWWWAAALMGCDAALLGYIAHLN